MSRVYQENFIAWIFIALLILLFLLIFTAISSTVGIILVLFLFISLNLLFYSCKIVADGNSLEYSFGIGLVSQNLHASQISGFGIEDVGSLIPWLYNPGGKFALLVHLKSGKTIKLPSREPRQIISNLESSI